MFKCFSLFCWQRKRSADDIVTPEKTEGASSSSTEGVVEGASSETDQPKPKIIDEDEEEKCTICLSYFEENEDVR